MSVFPTTGFFRSANVTARADFGINQQIVPGSTIYVTSTATSLAATIYSNPLLSIVIPTSTVVADVDGYYSYYIPLNYMVTETISSPNGGVTVIPNIGINGPLVYSLTTSANPTDTITVAGILSTSHVSFSPTNSSASGMIASTYVSSKAAGSLTITHPSSAGATFDLLITPY